MNNYLLYPISLVILILCFIAWISSAFQLLGYGFDLIFIHTWDEVANTELVVFLFSSIGIFIFFNLRKFLKYKKAVYLRYSAYGMIIDSIFSGLILLLPSSFHHYPELDMLSAYHLSLATFFTLSPSGIGGFFVGILIIYLSVKWD